MTTTQEVLEHRDAMLEVFTEITQDCQLLGLMPIGIQLNRWSNGNLDIGVQFRGTDTAAVDTLADSYGFGPADDLGDNYTRTGRVDLDGRRVEVRTYTGRPQPAAPAYPTGYAPQAVEA